MPMMPQEEWTIIFYQDARGKLLVDEWIRTHSETERARIFRTLELLRTYGIELKMPYARHLRGKVWELRIKASGNAYRILYAALVGRRFVLLHGFSKKTDKTPAREIETAERRLADYLKGEQTNDP